MLRKIFFIFILVTVLTACTPFNKEQEVVENKEDYIEEGMINLEGSLNDEEIVEAIMENDYKINLDFEREVKKGDNIWNLAQEEIKASLTGSKWEELGEAKQTYLIDALKDEIVENHLNYGISEDPDNLMIGTKIKFGKILEDNQSLLGNVLQKAQELNEEETANIIDNNQALQKAVNSGLQINSDNVDILIRQFK